MSDSTTTIDELKIEINKFVEERNWDKFQSLRALAISLSLESNEFLDHFQWLNDKEVEEVENDKSKHNKLGEELSDILSYILIASKKLNIDISTIFLEKLEKNKKKYPKKDFENLSWEKDNKKYQEKREEWESIK